jgi:hypothetical protein
LIRQGLRSSSAWHTSIAVTAKRPNAARVLTSDQYTNRCLEESAPAGVEYRSACGKLFTVTKGRIMSKGMDRRKEGKKKPTKTLQEKRAAKREKKQSRGLQF